MIKSNLMPSPSSLPSPSPSPSRSGKVAPQAVKEVKFKPKKKKPEKKKSRFGTIANVFYMLVIFAIASVLYLQFFGVPSFLRDVIPQSVVDVLGLSEETAATQVLREAGAARLTAHGTRIDDPTIPLNGSVEEVVKTMRPDIFFSSKQITGYRDKPLNNRIPFQKQSFHIMLSTFYKATPDGIGYLDLAYQAPNYYFARAIAQDSRTLSAYMDQLRSKVMPDMVTVRDSVIARDGSTEFVVYGSTMLPVSSELKSAQLVPPSRVKSEIMALRTLAVANQVRLVGWEKPIEEDLNTYRRVILRTTTEADYPSLLNFAEALQKSDVAFGVQQFVSRPAGPEKMHSALEFVLYSSLN